jgi:hypothetical protein
MGGERSLDGSLGRRKAVWFRADFLASSGIEKEFHAKTPRHKEERAQRKGRGIGD